MPRQPTQSPNSHGNLLAISAGPPPAIQAGYRVGPIDGNLLACLDVSLTFAQLASQPHDTNPKITYPHNVKVMRARGKANGNRNGVSRASHLRVVRSFGFMVVDSTAFGWRLPSPGDPWPDEQSLILEPRSRSRAAPAPSTEDTLLLLFGLLDLNHLINVLRIGARRKDQPGESKN